MKQMSLENIRRARKVYIPQAFPKGLASIGGLSPPSEPVGTRSPAVLWHLRFLTRLRMPSRSFSFKAPVGKLSVFDGLRSPWIFLRYIRIGSPVEYGMMLKDVAEEADVLGITSRGRRRHSLNCHAYDRTRQGRAADGGPHRALPHTA